MRGVTLGPRHRIPPFGRTEAIRVGAGFAVVLTLVALGGVLFVQPAEEHAPTSVQVRGISDLVYPAAVVAQPSLPADNTWTLPVAAVPVGDALLVLDTGKSRILRFDAANQLSATYDATTDPRLVLKQPMAMVTDGTLLYIANSLASEILVLDAASGHVQRSIPLAALTGREKAPRLIGLALLSGGRIAVSDADNHRVMVLSSEGRPVTTIGTGKRASGKDGFNVPGAIASDGRGHIFIVDTLNARVAEFSEEGAYVAEFGSPGVAAGGLQRPKGVAVDQSGRVFVSDGLGSVVDVFGPDGTYLGMIGRKNPADPGSMSLLRAPAGIWLEGGKLFVTDRIAGALVLQLGTPNAPPVPAPARKE